MISRFASKLKGTGKRLHPSINVRLLSASRLWGQTIPKRSKRRSAIPSCCETWGERKWIFYQGVTGNRGRRVWNATVWNGQGVTGNRGRRVWNATVWNGTLRKRAKRSKSPQPAHQE